MTNQNILDWAATQLLYSICTCFFSVHLYSLYDTLHEQMYILVSSQFDAKKI